LYTPVNWTEDQNRARYGRPHASNLQRSVICRLSGHLCWLCSSEGGTRLTATVFRCEASLL